MNIKATLYLLIIWLLILIGFSLSSNFHLLFRQRVNPVGDGLCDKCGAPATWEHYRENKLIGEYCDSHRFYGTPYLGLALGFIAFLAGCGTTILTIGFVLGDEGDRSPRLVLLRTLIIIFVLAIWFNHQYHFCHTIQQPTLEWTLGLNVFWMIVQLGAIVFGIRAALSD